MSVLRKFSNLSGIYHSAHGRVGIDECSPTRSSVCEILHHKQQRLSVFGIASLNVGSMTGSSNEVVETVSRRRIDLCCVQDCRWRDASARMLEDKECRYKFFWIGNDLGTGDVGMLLTEKWKDRIFYVKRVSDCLTMIKLVFGEVVITILLLFLSIYAPQLRLTISDKE